MTAEDPLRPSLWWSEKYEASRFSMSPCEHFVKNTLLLNYLLHGQRLKRPSDIENEVFRDYLSDLHPYLFGEETYITMYRQTLPEGSMKKMRELVWKRHCPPLRVEAPLKIKQVHGISFGEFDLYQDRTESPDVAELFNDQPLTELLQCKDTRCGFQRYRDVVERLADEGTLIPCTDVREDAWASADAPAASDAPQKVYSEFMSPNKAPLNASTAGCRPNTPLYWVDLRQVRYKHSKIDNEGDIDLSKKSVDYTVLNNMKNLVEDRNFYTHLMKNAKESTTGKVICPLLVFIVDGILYSHDHKRVAASLGVSNRYMLGCLAQNAELIIKREIGYYVQKGVFSREDRSMVLFLTEEQIETFGHYFFVVGPKSDYTPFMKTLHSHDVGETVERLRADSSLLLQPEFGQSPEGLFRRLHAHMCPDGNFTSLDRPEVLLADYRKRVAQAQAAVALACADLKNAREMKSKSKKPAGGKTTPSSADKREAKRGSKTSTDPQPEPVGQASPLPVGSCVETYRALPFKERKRYKKRIAAGMAREEKIAFFAAVNPIDEEATKEREIAKAAAKSATGTNKKVHCHPAVSYINGVCGKGSHAHYFTASIPVVHLADVRADTPGTALEVVENIAERLRQYLDEQAAYLDQVSPDVATLLKWELRNIGNSMWYLLHVSDIHPAIKRVVLRKYPFVHDMTQSGVLFNNPAYKPTGSAIRYGKTDDFALEDLVFVLRHPHLFGLGTTQLVSSAQLVEWQKCGGPMRATNQQSCPYLEPSALMKVFPKMDGNGLLTDPLLRALIDGQAPDHLRVFQKECEDGEVRYGAHQGLVESVKYTELSPCPPEMRYVIHLTRRNLAHPILSGEPTAGTERAAHQNEGFLVLLGRYIHSFGWAEEAEHGGFALIEDFWGPAKMRLYHRFKSSRVGIAVDMHCLKTYYDERNVPWDEVCGVNQIGTVIFLRRVPPDALQCPGRDWARGVPGTAMELHDMWRLDSYM